MASNTNRLYESEALSVPPLNSMPYIDPVATMCLDYESIKGETKPEETPESTLVYLPYKATDQETDNILSVANNGVVLTGKAAFGSVGPLVGKLDISESNDSYYFRVSLPGVAREDFTCDVAPDGQILIKGVTTTGEKMVYKDSMKFEMLTQNLSPPGPFSVSFKLPGPVDSQQLTAHFGIDGIFEGIVKKKIASN